MATLQENAGPAVARSLIYLSYETSIEFFGEIFVRTRLYREKPASLG